jgi:hypothetical protein
MKRNSIAAVLAGFVVLWIVLDRTAAGLGSFTGEAGIVVCLVVLAAAIAIEMAVARMALSAIVPWLFFLIRTPAP